MLSRRLFVAGLTSLVAAPAIVQISSLMPVRPVRPFYFGEIIGIPDAIFREEVTYLKRVFDPEDHLIFVDVRIVETVNWGSRAPIELGQTDSHYGRVVSKKIGTDWS